MAAKIRSVRVTRGDVYVARDFRIDFFKARAIARFRNQFARGQKTTGSYFVKITLCRTSRDKQLRNKVNDQIRKSKLQLGRHASRRKMKHGRK